MQTVWSVADLLCRNLHGQNLPEIHTELWEVGGDNTEDISPGFVLLWHSCMYFRWRKKWEATNSDKWHVDCQQVLEEGCIICHAKILIMRQKFQLSSPPPPARKFSGQCRAKHVFDLAMEYERMVSVCSLYTVLKWVQHTLICFWCWRKHCAYNACKAVKRSLQKSAQLLTYGNDSLSTALQGLSKCLDAEWQWNWSTTNLLS